MPGGRYAVCSNCGHRVGQYGVGSDHLMECPHCKASLQIRTEGRDTIVSLICTKQERNLSPRAAYQPA